MSEEVELSSCSVVERLNAKLCWTDGLFVTEMTDQSERKQLSSECLQKTLKISLEIIQKYKWLIDAYVLDFYVDDHWSKLPTAWKNHLEPLNPDDLASILRGKTSGSLVRPLSILCLMQLMKKLCIPTKVTTSSETTNSLMEHPKLKHIFTKCVKPKKRHEIAKMAKFCHSSVEESSVDFVVDVGAGLGHLARVLGYGYGVRVCCLEMQSSLNDQARVIDSQLEDKAEKYLSPSQRQHFRRPIHVTMKLTKSVSPEQFVDEIRKSLGISDGARFTFGIIGLHPCGDLGAILINMFLSCKQAHFLNFVGCCYMKLTTEVDSPRPGYPLSVYLKKSGAGLSRLSYESREIACHALEVYCDRLESGKYEDLRVHSFRATIERIFIKYWPQLKHTGLRNVKHAKGMLFEDYVDRATKGLDISVPSDDIHAEESRNDLEHWKRIVIFYTMRLMFAPLVESVILYDRMLYLRERGCSANISAIFDPRLSPRSHITSATKNHLNT